MQAAEAHRLHVLDTTRFGRIEVPPDSVLECPRGLIGFPGHRRFALLRRPHDYPLAWLQSLDDPELAFVVMDPRYFRPQYRPPVRAEVLQLLGASDEDDLEFLAFVVVPRQPERMSANLRAPLVVCRQTRRAIQVILDDGCPYRVRHYVFDEMQALAQGGECVAKEGETIHAGADSQGGREHSGGG